MNITLRNVLLVFEDQGPPSRFFRNLWKGHLLGLLSKRSHFRENGAPKVTYNSKATAEKSALNLSKKREVHFSNYKCLYCDGYHIGKNRDNKIVVSRFL